MSGPQTCVAVVGTCGAVLVLIGCARLAQRELDALWRSLDRAARAEWRRKW